MTHALSRWWWLALVAVFFACVALRLNGSSVGRWQMVLRETGPIRGLFLSTPKKIRSDEWVVWTPSMFAQARHNPPFPIENSNLGAGRAPLLMSIPVAYYTTFFRPQLWGFFLLDFERGFSWYWCTKVFGLFIASWWLLRQVGIQGRAVLAFGVVWIFFSSFVQWWFSSPAMLPEMVSSWALCLGCVIAFWQEKSRWRLALAFFGFVFFGINFVLCLYPPFQIPLCFLGLALLIGLWLEKRKTDDQLRPGRGLLLGAGATFLIVLILVPFWIEVWPTLELLGQTEYPGRRHNTGGGYSLWQLFAGPIGFFESENKVPPDFPNICEASNFYPLWLFAVLGVAVARVRKQLYISPLVIALTAVIAGLGVFCVVRLPEWILWVTLLGQVHEARALLTIGMANILLGCLFLDRYRGAIFGRFWGWSGAVCVALGIGALFFAIHARNAGFFADRIHLALLIAINAGLVALFFWDRGRQWLPPVFGLLLICSNGLINPVMRGLGPLSESAAFKELDAIRAADPEAKWIAFGDYVTAQVVKATGAAVLNGTKIVPDLSLFRQLDPVHKYETIYNRYAWIICSTQIFPEEVRFSLLQAEFFTIHLPPQLPLLREANYRYYVFPTIWRDASFYDFSLVTNSPEKSLWIYRRPDAP